jgi:hypothetical protein
MLLWANDFRAIFWVAIVPGMLAVALLLCGVREPDTKLDGKQRIEQIRSAVKISSA